MGLIKKKQKEMEQKSITDYEFTYHQVALDPDSYEIICKVKNQLIVKNRRPFNFSDAIRELKARGERR